MKTIYTLYIGTEYDKNHNYIPKRESHAAIEAIKREAGMMFDGYTMSFTIGGWNGPDDKPVEEHAIRLEIVTDSLHTGAIKELAQFAKILLKQESVMLLQQVVHFEMI